MALSPLSTSFTQALPWHPLTGHTVLAARRLHPVEFDVVYDPKVVYGLIFFRFCHNLQHSSLHGLRPTVCIVVGLGSVITNDPSGTRNKGSANAGLTIGSVVKGVSFNHAHLATGQHHVNGTLPQANLTDNPLLNEDSGMGWQLAAPTIRSGTFN